MRFELRSHEVEMIPESEFDRDVLERLHRARTVTVRDGRTTDTGYPSSSRKTNVVLVFPDPDDWGT